MVGEGALRELAKQLGSTPPAITIATPAKQTRPISALGRLTVPDPRRYPYMSRVGYLVQDINRANPPHKWLLRSIVVEGCK